MTVRGATSDCKEQKAQNFQDTSGYEIYFRGLKKWHAIPYDDLSCLNTTYKGIDEINYISIHYNWQSKCRLII